MQQQQQQQQQQCDKEATADGVLFKAFRCDVQTRGSSLFLSSCVQGGERRGTGPEALLRLSRCAACRACQAERSLFYPPPPPPSLPSFPPPFKEEEEEEGVDVGSRFFCCVKARQSGGGREGGREAAAAHAVLNIQSKCHTQRTNERTSERELVLVSFFLLSFVVKGAALLSLRPLSQRFLMRAAAQRPDQSVAAAGRRRRRRRRRGGGAVSCRDDHFETRIRFLLFFVC